MRFGKKPYRRVKRKGMPFPKNFSVVLYDKDDREMQFECYYIPERAAPFCSGDHDSPAFSDCGDGSTLEIESAIYEDDKSIVPQEIVDSFENAIEENCYDQYCQFDPFDDNDAAYDAWKDGE